MIESLSIPDGCAVAEASVMNGVLQSLIDITEDPRAAPSGNRRSLFLCFLHNVLLYDKIIVEQELGGRSYLADSLHSEENHLGRSNIEKFFSSSEFGNIIEFRTIPEVAGLEATIKPFARIFLSKLRQSSPPKVDLPADYFGYHGSNYDLPLKTTADCLKQSGLPPSYIPKAIFLYRGLRYAGYAQRLSRNKQSPVAYSASPGRILGLRYLLDPKDREFIEFCSKDYWELIETLSLPSAGYDFAEFSETFNPVLDSNLSSYLMSKSPHDAPSRVLNIRNSPEGESLRIKWAELVGTKRASIAHGLRDISIRNVVAGRDVNQVLIVGTESRAFRTVSETRVSELLSRRDAAKEAHTPADMKRGANMAPRQQMKNIEAGGDVDQRSAVETEQVMKSRQTMEGVTTVRAAGQWSDVANSEQSMKKVSAASATQDIRSGQDNLSIGKIGTARGRWAIVGLIIFGVAVIVSKVLFKLF